ncbi:hypothetical protein EYR40_007385 [Pleurotus pulmonarius]|nr:hypothetical protein EYR36_008222 [Pleurotus pulmonarius]KAF4580017.1 hypothetical protein EYR36_001837 [Pleurotus pulmonarius]KAF4596935.1 hypothetical protein EYR40_007385 [Pleurotus pulmonarius]
MVFVYPILGALYHRLTSNSGEYPWTHSFLPSRSIRHHGDLPDRLRDASFSGILLVENPPDFWDEVDPDPRLHHVDLEQHRMRSGNHTVHDLLRRSKGGATFKPTKTMLAKLLTFTLETGLITTGWMTLQLILQLALFRDDRHFRAYTALYSVWLLATLNARSSFNKDPACFVDVTNLPTVPGEIRFRHPTVEGTQVVISITTDGVTSHVERSEVDSD